MLALALAALASAPQPPSIKHQPLPPIHVALTTTPAQPPSLKHQPLPRLPAPTAPAAARPPSSTTAAPPPARACPGRRPHGAIIVVAPIIEVFDGFPGPVLVAPELADSGAVVEVDAAVLDDATADAPFVLDVEDGVRYQIDASALPLADRAVVRLPDGSVLRLDAWLGAQRIADGRALLVERDSFGAVFVTPL